jgi:transposase
MEISFKVTMGLDVSDHFSSYCLLATDGDVEQQGRIRTTPDALRSFFEGRKLRVVLEAGPHSPWISQLLEELGHEVIGDNARMVALIHKNPRKRDAVVRARTALISRARGAVKSLGGRIPKCSSGSFPDRAIAHLPDPPRPTLEPTLETIRHLTKQIRSFDR